uniref:DNA methylase N-4/N-6 domain-containing protein n=1 Tax=Phenylobacterium glaciei TaxID=2803784 RepID=A0A974P422_9CAUL|nr:hypothetical protein JKL49_00970 [Phenylobacterium glaciei]
MARNIMSADGVIFISIDDGEVGNLRKCCDEIFGADNLIANIIWQKNIREPMTRGGFRTTTTTYFAMRNKRLGCR